jgi:hypothetical protein
MAFDPEANCGVPEGSAASSSVVDIFDGAYTGPPPVSPVRVRAAERSASSSLRNVFG